MGWTEAVTKGKDAPDTFPRREGRFRRYKRLNYLRCCRSANRSATATFATVPTAAAIAPCRTDPGARRQAVCDLARNLAVARDSLSGNR
jgi:hypothetical protein